MLQTHNDSKFQKTHEWKCNFEYLILFLSIDLPKSSTLGLKQLSSKQQCDKWEGYFQGFSVFQLIDWILQPATLILTSRQSMQLVSAKSFDELSGHYRLSWQTYLAASWYT